MNTLTSEHLRPQEPLRSAAIVLRRALGQASFAGSLADCHAPGIDSIVLQDNRATNGGMTRIFAAHEGVHPLGDLINPNTGNYTIGVHDHRFGLRILPLLGTIVNFEVTIDPEGPETLHEYEFQSGINGNMNVAHTREVRTRTPVFHELTPGGSTNMLATDLHTVIVPDSETVNGMTAWMVHEGPEEKSSKIYSPTDHLQVSAEGLYTPMSPEVARARVAQIYAAIA